MPSTLVHPVSLPTTVDAHPRVATLLTELDNARSLAQLARATRDRLIAERESLDGAAVALVSLGATKQRDVDARATALDDAIAAANVDLEARDGVIRGLETDLRGAREVAKAEILAQVIDQVREMFGSMGKAFAEAERLAADVEMLRARYGVQGLPKAHTAALSFVRTWRSEAQRFGVAL